MISAVSVDFVENGGQVRRMHTMPVIKEQSVAAHSFGVAWWVYFLTGGNLSVKLIMAALSHDLPEYTTGDIPAPTKRAVPAIKEALDALEGDLFQSARICNFEHELSKEDKATLKVADALELAQYCVREAEMGNRTARIQEVFNNAIEYAQEAARTPNHRLAIELVTAKGAQYVGR